MAEFATIARPYAKALFSLAKEKNEITSWLNELGQLVAVVQQEKVAILIDEPETSATEKADLLANLVDLQSINLRNFLSVLANYKRLKVLPEVYTQYQDLTLSLNHVERALIISAYTLTDNQLADLTVELQKFFGSTLEVATQVDSELIGGIKVEVGDQVLDLSIQGKLNSLYTAMIN